MRNSGPEITIRVPNVIARSKSDPGVHRGDQPEAERQRYRDGRGQAAEGQGGRQADADHLGDRTTPCRAPRRRRPATGRRASPGNGPRRGGTARAPREWRAGVSSVAPCPRIASATSPGRISIPKKTSTDITQMVMTPSTRRRTMRFAIMRPFPCCVRRGGELLGGAIRAPRRSWPLSFPCLTTALHRSVATDDRSCSRRQDAPSPLRARIFTPPMVPANSRVSGGSAASVEGRRHSGNGRSLASSAIRRNSRITARERRRWRHTTRSV